MSNAHQRPKQPELVRAQLLAVVRRLLVEQGAQAVTLDLVAQQAGVTKGGLQYHFRSKQSLLEALSDELFGEFEAHYAQVLATEAPGPGRHARAYVRTFFDDDLGNNQGEAQRAIALLALSLPACRARWHARMQAELEADGDDAATAERLLICRLAADGFWLSQMLDTHTIDDSRKARLRTVLLGLCHTAVP